VVSGGRGLKGPENWNLVEDLASVLVQQLLVQTSIRLRMATNSEHVGQTGNQLQPIYIATEFLAQYNTLQVLILQKLKW
jgi:electron transfer flavoprotein alpha subunit